MLSGKVSEDHKARFTKLRGDVSDMLDTLYSLASMPEHTIDDFDKHDDMIDEIRNGILTIFDGLGELAGLKEEGE